GSTFAAMQRGVGDDLVARPRQQRKNLRVVDVVAPTLDELAVVDLIPREAAVIGGKAAEELVERVDVFGPERAQHHAPFVAENGFLRKSERHRAEDISGPRSED